jgi:hypothetical protein
LVTAGVVTLTAAAISPGVRPIETPEEAVRFRYPDGAPPDLAAAIVEGLKLMRADTIGLRTDTVRRLTGREPRTFAAWCGDNVQLFK